MTVPRPSLLARFRRTAIGAAAVEFAILALPVMMLLVGLVETGRAIHARTSMAHAADVAVRAVALNPTVSTADLQQAARDAFLGGPSGNLSLSRSTNGSGLDVIELQYPLTLLIPGLSDQGLTLSVSRRVP